MGINILISKTIKKKIEMMQLRYYRKMEIHVVEKLHLSTKNE